MSVTRQDLIQQIKRAEDLYKANLFTHLEPIITHINENFEILGDRNLADIARYYRICMLYIGVYEELNIDAMESYLNALINIKEVLPSDYEYVCSYYKQCNESVYEMALIAHPYNETLHLHYALKLQEEKRFNEAIITLKYILECYPALTEARFLLWDIQSTQLEQLCDSSEEADCYELLDLASATHNTAVLKGLQLDERLDLASQNLARIQVDLWERKASENQKQWVSEWRLLELNNTTRILLADYAKSFMKYDMVSQILGAPEQPNFPEEDYSNFKEYRAYMQALANSGWQLAQHQYVLIGNSSYYYSKNKKTLEICVERGLALNPKNPVLLVLKAKSFFFNLNYQETGQAYHEAYRNGLRMSEYLFYLLEVNSRIESWQGILDIVVQFHRRKTPTLKTLFFQARALVKLGRFDEAHEVINEALNDFPLPPHSYAPWLYNLRMVIHKRNQNFTAFFEDMYAEIEFYKIGDSDYCSTMNMCIEALIEMGDYKEAHKYAIYNYEQEQLAPELYTVFKWICFFDYLAKPDDLPDVTTDDLIDNPTTFLEHRNNGFVHWMLGDNTAAATALQKTAPLATNKAYYLKLALSCANEGFGENEPAITLCETIQKEVPQSRDWKLGFDYANLLHQEQRYAESYDAFQKLLQNYPDYCFFQFEKDEFNVLLKVLKEASKGFGYLEDYTKYNAMFLSRDKPSELALLEHLEIAKTNSKDDIFLQHNLLENISKLDIAFENDELETLKQIKSKIRSIYFA
ncbi:tetratricopeptide repeat protein [uncultured Formosa sp.]|uniref:tetratricopeptide repeat protein n=1 Tax=uncultured Formosa sp. TaxID=255435 RepID=UPI00262FD705|nr:tetratricopeptide repeat protein [uncultured Formosa sp.]